MPLAIEKEQSYEAVGYSICVAKRKIETLRKVRGNANALLLQEWQDNVIGGCDAPIELSIERKEWHSSLVGSKDLATATPQSPTIIWQVALPPKPIGTNLDHPESLLGSGLCSMYAL